MRQTETQAAAGGRSGVIFGLRLYETDYRSDSYKNAANKENSATSEKTEKKTHLPDLRQNQKKPSTGNGFSSKEADYQRLTTAEIGK